MKQKDKILMMDIAYRAAQDSTAIRMKVGGVITDAKGNFVASGYNGTVRGFHTNDCETKIYQKTYVNGEHLVEEYPYSDSSGSYKLVTDERITVHTEQNLIYHAARRGISIEGGTVFLTLSPCSKCAGALIQCGIQEVIYNERYRSMDETEELYGKYIKFTKWGNE